MFGFFSKPSPEEIRKANLFAKLVQYVPNVMSSSYRKKGRYEIIFDKNQPGEITDPQNQALFNLLANAWLIIWENDQAELHVGMINKIGYRLKIDAAKLYIGYKWEDHEEKLKELFDLTGIHLPQR